jgi:DNA-binding CsgD family transcriptional regulator
MGQTDLERGRTAYGSRAWDVCCEALTAADEAGELPLEDLELLSIARYLCGDEQGSLSTVARAHRLCVERERWREATETAFWHSWILDALGDHARANGWVTRARSIIAEHGVDGVAAALPLVAEAREHIMSGRLEEALATARAAADAGRRLGSADLLALGLLTVGQALVKLGRSSEALPCLDEVMVAVSSDELTPTVAGLSFCAVIATCMHLSDLRRAREWTMALSDWCETQSGLVPYKGQCLVHRTQIMTMQGSWTDALAEAQIACERLVPPAVGDAWYQVGEVHRLRGDFAYAEDAYRRANGAGRQPEPGLAQLRMAQGRLDAAVTTLRRLYDEHGRMDRTDILVAYADAMTRAGDIGAARAAALELQEVAQAVGAPLQAARADEALAAVRITDGATHEALALLRGALRVRQELGMPYDAAVVRVRIGDALVAAGDPEAAQLEYDAALATFAHLGARPDVERLTRTPPAGLTDREVEVVRLVAAGASTRDIAERLVLSEKTVARHLSNIYAKLDVSSRAGATAYAYDHHLL